MPNPTQNSGSRRNELKVEAINPIDGKKIEIYISYERLLRLAKLGKGHIEEAKYCLTHALQHPTAIFEGLRRDEDDDRWGVGWRCYCGLPDKAFNLSGTEKNAPAGQVYVVFVNDEYIAYNWRFEMADSSDRKLVKDFETRFKRRFL